MGCTGYSVRFLMNFSASGEHCWDRAVHVNASDETIVILQTTIPQRVNSSIGDKSLREFMFCSATIWVLDWVFQVLNPHY